MLTYPLGQRGNRPLYQYLADRLRDDLAAGVISPGERLPSKRRFAEHHGVSLVTVEAAYRTLLDEGFIEARERRGYFAAALRQPGASATPAVTSLPPLPVPAGESTFPYATWSRTIREVLRDENERSLALAAESPGAIQLRQALTDHIRRFNGLEVDPERIVIGAGSQTLDSLVADMLGPHAHFGVEDPGYPLLPRLYEARGVAWSPIPLDASGLSVDALEDSGVTAAHVTPSAQFPTGIAMPMARRYELLSWASKHDDRYLIEDDYAREFVLDDPALPTLASIDPAGRVIYTNTLTLTLGAGFRMGYMVLPEHLVPVFHERLGFLACTVSALEQLALARFLGSGGFERHIHRLRTHYRRLREQLVTALADVPGLEVASDRVAPRLLVQTSPDATGRACAAFTCRGATCRPLADFRVSGRDEADPTTLLVDYRALEGDSVAELADRVRHALAAPSTHPDTAAAGRFVRPAATDDNA
ncbi:MAG: PLP-dependent aminotransferase family protein [Actinomycetaceae bacterium]|nr:PLP-dependent aminotransferase family protein [Actinomycetaceae bacterium]MDU0969465.1 PLP-dependent aminotransferase family protein [Actinomycetaceae bacterium]